MVKLRNLAMLYLIETLKCYTWFIVPVAYLVIMLMFTFSLFMPCYLYLFLCWKSLGLTQSLWLTQFVSPLFLPFPPSRFTGWEYNLVQILPSSKALSCTAWISLGYGLICYFIWGMIYDYGFMLLYYCKTDFDVMDLVAFWCKRL